MIERQDLHGDEQGVVILSMNRPEGKNAFSRSFMEAFHQAINELDVDETRILILRSHVPGVFCAGADLKERAQMTDAEVVQFLDRLGNLLIRIEALPFPTLAIVHGAAFGGGLELALACDLRIGTSSTQEKHCLILPPSRPLERAPQYLQILDSREGSVPGEQ